MYNWKGTLLMKDDPSYRRTQNRVIEYTELEGTCKDHRIQLLSQEFGTRTQRIWLWLPAPSLVCWLFISNFPKGHNDCVKTFSWLRTIISLSFIKIPGAAPEYLYKQCEMYKSCFLADTGDNPSLFGTDMPTHNQCQAPCYRSKLGCSELSNNKEILGTTTQKGH